MEKENQKKESVEKKLSEMEKTQTQEDIRKAHKYNKEDKTIKMPLDKFSQEMTQKDNIQKIGLNLETNIMSLTLNNAFVFSVLSNVWGANLETYKTKYPRAIKNIVSENTNQNPEIFINALE